MQVLYEEAEPVELFGSRSDALFAKSLPPELLRLLPVESWNIHALFDASQSPLIPELLEARNARFDSLYQGATAEELSDLAPYLVDIGDSAEFAADIFSAQPAEACLTPKLLVFTENGFNTLRAHLRKFCRAVDDTGQHMLFRFWEDAVLLGLRYSPELSKLGQQLIKNDHWATARIEGAQMTLSRYRII